MSTIKNRTDNESKLIGGVVTLVAAGITYFVASKTFDFTTTILVKGLLKTGIIEVE